MKKFLSILAVLLLTATLFPLSAAAHGHGGNGGGNQLHHSYAQCTATDCSVTTTHRHGKTWYGGHTAEDGHSHHSVCTVSGCAETAVHEHDGVTCFPQSGTGALSGGHTRYRSIGRHH